MTTLPSSDAAAGVLPGRWTLDLTATTAAFTARGLFGHRVHGTVPFTAGRVDIAADGSIAGARLEADLARIDTGNRRRDADLAGPKLLDAAARPTMVVRIGGAALRGGQATVGGVLSLRGQEVPVRLEVRLGRAADPGSAQVDVTTTFSRDPLRMRAPHLLIGRDVEVHVTARFRRDGD